MNNLKKVLALVVAIAMFASMGVFASAQTFADADQFGNSADAINLLSDLGIINGYPEDNTFKPANTITRAEAAAIMVRMMGLEENVVNGPTMFTDVAADNWASGYVNVAVAHKIVNGMGDGTFAPNAEVTYEQVVKMIVCALGYEPAAAKNGGWPNGYITVAASQKVGITKGVGGAVGTAASRATVAKLVYNALEVELMDQETYSTGTAGDEWKIQEGKTILSEYLELEKVDGVVVDTYLASSEYDKDADKTIDIVVTKNYEQDASKKSDADYVKGDVYSFIAESADAAALLGYTVTAYVGENEDEDDAVFAIAEKQNKNSMTVIDTEDSVDTDSEVFTTNEDGDLVINYYKTSSSKSTTEAKIVNTIKGYYDGTGETLKAVDNFVINGFLSDDAGAAYTDMALNDALLSQVEEIRFLDNNNDGDFEYAFVTLFGEEGVELQVDEVDVEDLYITGKDNNDLDLDDDDKLIEIIKDGEVVGIDAIAENDVVTVLDKDAKVMTVYVSSATVEGTVDEIYDDEYKIAGKNYKISGNDDDYGVKAEDLSAGDDGIYYLNYEGKIAYVDTVNTISGAEYVYIIANDVSDGDFDDNSLLVKVVTKAGEVEVLTVKSKKVDIEVSENREDNYEDLDDIEGETCVKSVLDEKLIDGKGQIAKIKTNAAGEITEFYFPGAKDFDSVMTYNEPNTKEYSEAKGRYSTLSLPSTAIVFNYNPDEEELEDAITVSTVENVFEDEGNYEFAAYGKDRDNIDCVVTNDADVTFNAEAPVMVVTATSKTVYNDDDTYKITGVMAGETVSFIADTEDDDAIDAAADVVKGNVIVFSKTSANLIKDITVLVDSTEDDPADGLATFTNDDIIVHGEGDAEKNVSVMYGEVVDKLTGGFFRIGSLATYDEADDATFTEFVGTDDCNYTVVDYTTNKLSVTSGSYGSMKESKEGKQIFVFVKTSEDSEEEVTDVVIFKL